MALGGDLTIQQRLIYNACRWGALKLALLIRTIFSIRKRAYIDELELQARRVGCPGRRARLHWNPTMQKILRESRKDAQSIVDTFNSDLINAIIAFGIRSPNASFYAYLRYLKQWEKARNTWKIPQVLADIEARSRADALGDFYEHNRIEGSAIMLPETAVCPVCQGWIDRVAKLGSVPLKIAVANRPPYHNRCPHYWVTLPVRVRPGECPLLWMG